MTLSDVQLVLQTIGGFTILILAVVGLIVVVGSVATYPSDSKKPKD